jgi:quinol monooxygenase YgiN
MNAVVVVATVRPVPGHHAAVVTALETTIARVHAEDSGCLLYALNEGDGELVMIEKWASADALAEHSRGKAITALNEALDGHVEGPPDVRILQPHPAGTPAQGTL